MRTLLIAIFALASAAAWTLPPPQRVYSVQVAAVSANRDEQIRDTVTSLTAAGWKPVYTRPTTDTAQTPIWVGQFETQADATWWKLALRRRGYPDAFTVSRDNDTATTPAGARGPLEPNFRTPANFAALPTRALDTLGDSMAGARRQVLTTLLSEGPEANTATETETQQLVDSVAPIANGDTRATRLEVCRARLAIAHGWHYGGKRRWLTSYHCYGEALALAPRGSREEAECLLQRAALLLELARSGIGTMEECRYACLRVQEQVATSNTRAQVVSALMHAEALYYDQRYEEAISEFLGLQTRFPDRVREHCMANTYAGIAYAKLGRPAEAEQHLRLVIDAQPEAQDLFVWRGKTRDVQVDASKWLAVICESTGRHDEASSWRRFAKTRSLGGSAAAPAEALQ
jgi:hypothetical protein